MDGKEIPRAKGFRFGHAETLEGILPMAWLETEGAYGLGLRVARNAVPWFRWEAPGFFPKAMPSRAGRGEVGP